MNRVLLASLLAVVFVVVATAATQAAEEAVEVELTPVVVQDLNFQYGDAQFSWHRIHTDEFQIDVNNQGDIRLGVRGDVGKLGGVTVHGRLLGTLSGTDLTEIRPEVMFYQGDWYSYLSVGVDTSTGEASLYDETVWDFAADDNWKFGAALVHNGGLSGQTSTVNIGPHFNVQLSKDLNLDLHYGWGITDDTSDEAWAIVGFTL